MFFKKHKKKSLHMFHSPYFHLAEIQYSASRFCGSKEGHTKDMPAVHYQFHLRFGGLKITYTASGSSHVFLGINAGEKPAKNIKIRYKNFWRAGRNVETKQFWNRKEITLASLLEYEEFVPVIMQVSLLTCNHSSKLCLSGIQPNLQ